MWNLKIKWLPVTFSSLLELPKSSVNITLSLRKKTEKGRWWWLWWSHKTTKIFRIHFRAKICYFGLFKLHYWINNFNQSGKYFLQIKKMCIFDEKCISFTINTFHHHTTHHTKTYLKGSLKIKDHGWEPQGGLWSKSYIR